MKSEYLSSDLNSLITTALDFYRQISVFLSTVVKLRFAVFHIRISPHLPYETKNTCILFWRWNILHVSWHVKDLRKNKCHLCMWGKSFNKLKARYHKERCVWLNKTLCCDWFQRSSLKFSLLKIVVFFCCWQMSEWVYVFILYFQIAKTKKKSMPFNLQHKYFFASRFLISLFHNAVY